MQSARRIVIDIGTHKLEELRVLFAPGGAEIYALAKWSVKRFLKGLVSLNFSELPSVVATIRLFFKPRNGKVASSTKFICVEPNIDVCISPLERFKRRFDVDFYPVAILGHTHEDDISFLGLNCYENTLSSSLYSKNGLSEIGRLACIGIHFSKFLDLLQQDLKISVTDEVILRVNCEGAELGIVRALRDSGLPVKVVYGSLADVRKIHGKKEYAEMLSILAKMGVSYQYFVGSNPATWFAALGSTELHRVIYGEQANVADK